MSSFQIETEQGTPFQVLFGEIHATSSQCLELHRKVAFLQAAKVAKIVTGLWDLCILGHGEELMIIFAKAYFLPWLQSSPPYPEWHWHRPKTHSPCPLHPLGHPSVISSESAATKSTVWASPKSL